MVVKSLIFFEKSCLKNFRKYELQATDKTGLIHILISNAKYYNYRTMKHKRIRIRRSYLLWVKTWSNYRHVTRYKKPDFSTSFELIFSLKSIGIL